MNALSTFQAKKLTVWIFRILFSTRTWKIVFVLASLSSMYGTYWFAKKTYNFRCGVNNQVVGYFTTKATCDDLNSYWFAYSNQSTEEFKEDNADLFQPLSIK
jgi:hypothetical protein